MFLITITDLKSFQTNQLLSFLYSLNLNHFKLDEIRIIQAYRVNLPVFGGLSDGVRSIGA